MNVHAGKVAAPARVSAVVIGGGHNGLAMSRCLDDLGIDHVVLERGEVANSWRTERWNSLRLLTPNWQCRLPGHAYDGDDPDGFMDVKGVADFIEDYSKRISAPIRSRTRVTSVSEIDGGYRVVTDQGAFQCRAVVMANGNFSIPKVPAVSAGVPPAMAQVTVNHYKCPEQLDRGGVLVVGASATGLQLAREIHLSGRPVTLAIGEHVRMPRTYRGKDIQFWMDAVGILNQRYTEVDDIARARRVPSPQLVGTPDHETLDLNSLRDDGVQLVGRLSGIRDAVFQFSGSLANHCKLADLKMGRLLDTIDAWIAEQGLDSSVAATERGKPTVPASPPALTLDTSGGRINTVLWATGYRPDYTWLDVPVFDRKGNLRHDGGVVEAPGVYAMGMTFMRRRKSSFIHGAEDDARDLGRHLAGYIRGARGRTLAGAAVR